MSVAAVDRALYLARESPAQPITVVPPPESRRSRHRFAGKNLLWNALEFVRTRRRFRGNELPSDLPEGTRLVLTRRLVREGLLRIARPD